ncbi:annexin D3-like isoform X1 [Carex rostrata]
MSTIDVPNPLPSPKEDAQELKKAFDGLGTNEKVAIKILGRRTAEQRAEIRRTYAVLYKKSLLDRLQSELSGDFRKAMILWMMDPAERDAKLVHEALKKKGEKAMWVVIEVSCASTPDHLIAVRRIYRSLFFSSLEEDIASSSLYKEPLRGFLVRLVSSYRYTDDYVMSELAIFEASLLINAVKKRELHDEDFLRIITTRNKSQLKATFLHYKRLSGKSIDEDIDHHSSSQFANMMIRAIWCLASPEKHFAEVIRYSIEGLGTDEDTLTRAIVCRAEIDMKRIKEEYKATFKTTVTCDVIGDTSGDYKEILLTLVGSEET